LATVLANGTQNTDTRQSFITHHFLPPYCPMTLPELLSDQTKKAKEKVAIISNWLLAGSLPADELLALAAQAKDADKGTCIEALELATRQNAAIADEQVLAFVTGTLSGPAPRVKWESAKVIGNIAKLFPAKLKEPIHALLINTKDKSTVVRWAAAFALGEILQLKTGHHKPLLPILEAAESNEQDQAIRKKYQLAIAKAKK